MKAIALSLLGELAVAAAQRGGCHEEIMFARRTPALVTAVCRRLAATRAAPAELVKSAKVTKEALPPSVGLPSALVGPEGIARVAGQCHARTRALVDRLTQIEGVDRALPGPFFHEAVLRLPTSATAVVERLAESRILGGVALGRFDGARENELLVCATEKRTDAEIERFARALTEALATGGAA